MAFKKVEQSSSGSIPFFDEWKKELSQEYIDFLIEKLIEPKKIKQVESGKGFLLNFDDSFMVFVWKSSTIGTYLKRVLREETGNLILLQFTKTKKGLSFDLGVDEEVETTFTEDKFEENIFYSEVSSGNSPSIAPNENRKSLSDLPELQPKKSVTFTTTPKASPKPKS